MLAHKGHLGIQPGQARVVVDRQVRRVEHALEREAPVQPLRQGQDMMIGLRRGSDDHLRRLSRRGETLSPPQIVAPHQSQALAARAYALVDEAHGLDDRAGRLLRSQQIQRILRGQLDVDAHAVGKHAEASQQFG